MNAIFRLFLSVIFLTFASMISGQNNALDFNGTDNYIDIGSGPGAVKSIELWVYPETTTEYLVDIDGTANIWIDNGTVTATGFTSPTIYVNGIETNNISADIWQHVVVTTSTSIDASNFDIGRQGAYYHDGNIDEIRIWDDVRTKAEIRSNMYQELSNTDNLVAYYKLNSSTGETATDSKGTYNGTLTGTGFTFDNNASPSPAFFGPKNCLVFDGSNEFVDIGSVSSTVNTVEFWVYPETTSEYLVDLNGSAYIWIDDGTVTATGFTNPTIYVDGYDTTKITADSWHHIAVITSSVINATGLDIGRQDANYFEGRIDELRLWSNVRTQDEIIEYMCMTLTGNENNLEAYYNFDNTSGDDLQNFTGASYDGILSNMESEDWSTSAAFNTWLNTTSTDWGTGANWSDGAVPTLTDNVGIPEHGSNEPSVDEVIATNHLVVGNGVTLPFNAGASHTIHGNWFVKGNADVKNGENLTVTGHVMIRSSGTLDIEANGYLTVDKQLKNWGTCNVLSTSTGTGSLIVDDRFTGDINIQRYLVDDSWHLVTPSTTNVTANDFFWDDDPMCWLTSHSEASNDWTYNTDLGTSMPVGQGWSVWVADAPRTDAIATMTGTPRTSNLDVSLSCSGSGDEQGWNLLGNPFTSSLDWDEGSWGANTTGTAYVWDNDYNGGDYRTRNGTEGDLTDGIIPISQGFFVKATSGENFTIPADARVHNSTVFYKSGEQENESPYVRIQMDFGDHGNTVFVGFPENGTSEFDKRGDAHKLRSSLDMPQIYVMENNVKLSTNALEPLTEEGKTVPFYLDQVVDGSYTFTLSQMENLPDVKIILEDIKEDVTQDISENPVYGFTASATDDPNRFLLHFKSTAFGIDDANLNNHLISIYSVEKRIYVNSSGAAANEQGFVEVFTITGQKLLEQKITSGSLISIPVEVSGNNLIVRVVKPSGVKTEKVFII